MLKLLDGKGLLIDAQLRGLTFSNQAFVVATTNVQQVVATTHVQQVVATTNVQQVVATTHVRQACTTPNPHVYMPHGYTEAAMHHKSATVAPFCLAGHAPLGGFLLHASVLEHPA